jgi:DNA mismatch repair protein MutS
LVPTARALAVGEIQTAAGGNAVLPVSKLRNVSSQTTDEVDASLLSPMMAQYVEYKRAHPSYLVLLRCGDFFETFFEDAVTFSQIADLALTSKDAGKSLGARVPMAGIPYHTLDEKIRILLAARVNVAVVDQVEPSSSAQHGALVRRAVTRLISPGTLIDDALLDTTRPNYLAAVAVDPLNARCYALALADVATGELRATDALDLDALQKCIRVNRPAELLLPASPASAAESNVISNAAQQAGVTVLTPRPIADFDLATSEQMLRDRFRVDNVESLGIRGRNGIIRVLGALLSFVGSTLEVDGRGCVPFSPLQTFSPSDCMELDETALRNLEIVESMRDGAAGKSLRWAVDRTVTAMGGRRVRSWLLAPLKDVESILRRQRIVVCLVANCELRSRLRKQLRGTADLERLAGRVGGDRASPRELQRLAQSLLKLPGIVRALRESYQYGDDKSDGESSRPFAALIESLSGNCGSFGEGTLRSRESLDIVADAISQALVDPAPTTLMSSVTFAGRSAVNGSSVGWDIMTGSSQIFVAGYNADLDELRASEANPELWMAEFESKEQKRAGILSIRVKRMRNSGYSIRVPRSTAERKEREAPSFFSDLGWERSLSTKTEIRFKSQALLKRERDDNAQTAAIVKLEVEVSRFCRSLDPSA